MKLDNQNPPEPNPLTQEKTLAQLLFEGKKILTSRPEGMEREEYKFLKGLQDKAIRKIFRRKPTRNHPMPLRWGYNQH